MFKDNFKIKQERCLICFQPIHREVFLITMVANPHICIHCFRKFKVIYKKTRLENCCLTILYQYTDFFKSLLFQYKGQYDYALAKVFLDPYIYELHKQYSDFIVAPCPSSRLQNEKRGFAPMEEIAKTLKLPLFTGLCKLDEYKQSDQHYKVRDKIKDHIGIQGGEILVNKKVLLIDDVLTSGNTLKTCVALLKGYHPKQVDILVLSVGVRLRNLSSESSF